MRIGAPMVVPTPTEHARHRLLTLLAREPMYPRWGPGRWSWGALRRAIGGGVPAPTVRAALDGLLADGLAVEYREAPRVGRTPRHGVALARRWHEAPPGALLEAVGRRDVLEGLGIRVGGAGTHEARPVPFAGPSN